jgi:hypothetical protein
LEADLTPPQIQFWSLVAVIAIAVLNLALIPLLKGAMKGQVGELKDQFEKIVETHNVSDYAHPAMTRAAREEVDRVADNAQSSAAGVAKTAQEAAAGVAKTAQEAVSKVAADAAAAVAKVSERIEAQFEKIRAEMSGLRKEVADLRLELASSQHGRIRKIAREA